MTTPNALFTAVHAVGFELPTNSVSVNVDSSQLEQLCEKLSPLFERSKLKHSQHSDLQLLLGLFTLHHEKLLHQLNAQQESLLAMQRVIDGSLENKHAAAFKSPLIIEFWLTMHLWLFVQGQLEMDYSLANDYATEGSLLLVSFTPVSADELRCEWNESFYKGSNILKEFAGGNKGIRGWLAKVFK
ncbi:hypothetical protein A6E01_17865 [Vibrio breoganii]|uniref:Uncharacterized protein n=1 Tax=Vibrio breoganii TaxID=553239 RepID=A0AAN0XYV0_9VIBR|nr:hypothetical protein [Vibrio breoganii]ANO35041.1 hypothetical protein A6E01_17865 [Vibrio breoganii]